MINRSICIFPEFQNQGEIDRVREIYDPLYSFVPPHITLVHPFKSNLPTSELIDHINNCLDGMNAFDIRLRDLSGSQGEYLFLKVKKGNDSIIELRDRMYKGILKEFQARDIPYIPHLTVGRMDNEEAFRKALERTKHFQSSFETTVTHIAVETIAEDGQSTIEYEYRFDG
ncbi:2'-5' RNA ligase family protein [Rossellomorea aquimaris]|uniref:2'-5' RNA ligase family protein n=1 Tax=Rossellomorea aquimaris TaxID=189382 RepID=UPI001CD434B0|nr:2'-5' RNA ligase family protein [Rossellomorea aquimaris]MCA1055747.1 2'-5' RNA ligase family protein [Rossellomorea aquimaris]